MTAATAEQPGTDGPHRTYCRLCEAQCGLVAQVRDGVIIKVGPDRDHPVSEGHLCVKGPGMLSITYDPDRVLTPLKRVGGPGEFVAVSWDEALDDIAARLRPVMAQPGADIGIYVGNPASFATLRAIYTAQFLKAIGGTKRFSSLHIDTGAKNIAQELLFGSAVDWTFPDLEDCDFLIIMGGNPMVSHMSLIAEPRALHKLAAVHERGAVVVVDPRRTETAKRFEHFPLRPDSDAWLLAAMLHHIFATGLESRAVLEARTSGWEELRAAVADITPERAAERCGTTPEAIRDLAERFALARTAACYGRVGTNRGRFSTLTNVLIESINVVTGRFGEPGGWISGVAPLAAAAATPPVHPRYGDMRSRIGDLPMVLAQTPGGAIAAEITTPGEGQMRALFLDSGNPVLSYPGGDALAEALEQLDLLVAIDLYVTESARHAHYILPSTTFFERDDFTDYWVRNATRPWVQYSPAVIPPVGEARQEHDIYNAILERLGLPPVMTPADDGSGLSPLMQATDAMLRAGVHGDHQGARPEGLSIATLARDHPSGVRVADRPDAAQSWDRVWTQDKRVQLWHPLVGAEMARLLAEAEAPADRLSLFGRRKLGSLNSWMHNVDRLVRNEKPTLLIHPDDARMRGILDGQVVRITSAVGSVDVEAELSADVIAGSVNYPHGWGHKGGWQRANGLPGTNINLIASSRPEDWEQASGMVHVDGISVSVTAV